MFKSGFVSIIGRPNVGKSTLMNLLVGEKIAIVSNRPQTTRGAIRGILTGPDYQIVFVDTPGYHRPKTRLGEYMLNSVRNALSGADIVLYMVEPSPKIGAGDEAVLEFLAKKADEDSKVILVINKADKVPKPEILLTIERYANRCDFAEIVPISATQADNTDALLAVLQKYLPEGPVYFEDDIATDQPERQIAAEIVREKALWVLREEVPHGIAVEIVSMKEEPKITRIEANILCEQESHKSIIIGKNGQLLKKIGSLARGDIEAMTGRKVYLELWVKHRKNWRDNEGHLRSLGYAEQR